MSDSNQEKHEHRLTRVELGFVARLSVVANSRMFGLFMVLPVLALWAGELRGATPLLVGIAVGGYGVTQALLQIPYGALSDRIGRGPVLLFGLSIFLLGSLIAGASESIYGVIIGRLLQGAGAISATLSAWLADHTRARVRTLAMAIFGVSIGASFLLALVLGPLLAAWLGVRGLFWASAGLGALGILLVAQGIRRHPGRPAGERAQRERVDWRQVLRRDLIELDLAVLVLHAALTGFFVLAPYLLKDRLGFAPQHHWKLYTLTLAASLPLALPMIMRDGRERSGRYLLPALVMLVGGFCLMGLSGSALLAFGAGCTVFFAGFSYLEASLPALISVRAADHQRGASLGLFSSAQFFGAFVGAGGAGWIIGLAGAETALWSLTSLLAVWLLASAFSFRR